MKALRVALGAILAGMAISIAPGAPVAIASPSAPCSADVNGGDCAVMPGNDFHHFTRCTRSENLVSSLCLEDDALNSLLDKEHE